MGTNVKEDYISEDQCLTDAMKPEDFVLAEGTIEVNGKICREQLEDALLADPDNCGICGWVYWFFYNLTLADPGYS